MTTTDQRMEAEEFEAREFWICIARDTATNMHVGDSIATSESDANNYFKRFDSGLVTEEIFHVIEKSAYEKDKLTLAYWKSQYEASQKCIEEWHEVVRAKDARIAELEEALEEHHENWNQNGLCMSECSALCKALRKSP
jgi:hypothetical protein